MKPITIDERIGYLIDDILRDLYDSKTMTDDERDGAMSDWDNRVEAMELVMRRITAMKGLE